MKLLRVLKPVGLVAVLGGAGFAGYETRARWLPLVAPAPPAAESEHAPDHDHEATAPPNKVVVSEQAQENLGLTARRLEPQTFWKTVPVPGIIVDRPGLTDRGVVAPATGVVAQIHRLPGEVVRPGDRLFTLKLLSESLHLTQTELFKTTQDVAIAQAQRDRLAGSGGTVPESRLIEADNQLSRLRVAVLAYRQELLNRGFGPDLIDGIAAGKFVSEIPVLAPQRPAPAAVASPGGPADPTGFEMQDLKVDLGQQVQAGQTLCLLADHTKLAVEGRAFRDETPLLERSVREGWPVEVDFQEDAGADWPAVPQPFLIRHLSNSIDPVNRTFAFQIPMENQSRAVERDGRTQTLWRYRPGQKVRLQVRAEKLDNVFVVPADAVAREGPEAFVFTQNDNTFERKPVRVLLQDRRRVVLANDGALPPGVYVVQSGAAQLNRMLKAGTATGAPKGYHMHADGSLHKNGEEEK